MPQLELLFICYQLFFLSLGFCLSMMLTFVLTFTVVLNRLICCVSSVLTFLSSFKFTINFSKNYYLYKHLFFLLGKNSVC